MAQVGERPTVTVYQATVLLGLKNPSYVYALIYTNQLEAAKSGGRWRVYRDAIERRQAELAARGERS